MRQDRKALAMLDIPELPPLAFRRRLGSLAPATLEGGGNPLEDLLGGIGDAITGVVDAVSDVLSSVDDFVNDVIPGGWATIGAAALMAYGIYDPELLAAAETEEGVTSVMLENAGYDAVEVANGVANIAPEVVSTTEAAITSGVSPDLIAMANATADPIAALNAAAGWTASDAAYLASIGYTGLIVNPVTGAAVDMQTALMEQHAETMGWQNVSGQVPGSQYVDANGTYFNSAGEPVAYTQPDGSVLQAGQTAAPTGGPMSAGPGPVAGANQTIVAGTEVGQQIPGAYSVDAGGTYYDVNGQVVATTQANGGVVANNGLQLIDPTIDISNMTQEQLNQALSQNNPYLESGPGTQVASAETPFRVDVSGSAGFEGNPTAVTGPLSEGSQLATQAQIDAGTATYNPAANAWEVAGTPAELSPITPFEIPAGTSTIAPGVDLTLAPEVATLASSVPAEVLATANAAVDPLASLIEQMGWTPGATAAAAGTAALASGAGGTGAAGAVEAVAPVTASPVVAPPAELPPLSPIEPVAVTPSQPIPEVVAPPATTTPPVDYTGPGIGEVPNPAEVPVTDLSRPAVPMGPSPYDWVAPAVGGAVAATVLPAILGGGGGGATPAAYGPLPPVNFGKLGDLANPGLNPGFIQARPFYNTTSPVQAQYYWGNHPYAYNQADLANYNTIPYAPAVPWGVQQAQAPFDVNQFIRSTINPQTQAAAAGTAPEYYAPYAPATAYAGGKV